MLAAGTEGTRDWPDVSAVAGAFSLCAWTVLGQVCQPASARSHAEAALVQSGMARELRGTLQAASPERDRLGTTIGETSTGTASGNPTLVTLVVKLVEW